MAAVAEVATVNIVEFKAVVFETFCAPVGRADETLSVLVLATLAEREADL